MRFKVRALFAAALAAMIFVLGSQQGSAEDVISYQWPEDGSYIDTTQGLTVGMTLIPDSDVSETSARYRVNDGTPHLHLEAGPALASGEFYASSHWIPASALQAGCVNGSVSIMLEMVLFYPDSSENLGQPVRTYDCGVGPGPVTVLPTPMNIQVLATHCGPANDDVTYVQEHISVSGSRWDGNYLWMTLVAAPGYVFASGSSTLEVNYYEDLNMPCLVTPDEIFFQIESVVCGSANDLVSYSQPNVSADGGVWQGNELVFTLNTDPGYTFAVGTRTSIAYTDENTPCIVTPDESFFQIESVVCGPLNDVVSYNQPNVSADGGMWQGNERVFTLTANPGYTFAVGPMTTIGYTDENTPCPVTPDASFFEIDSVVCGPANDVVYYVQDNVSADSGSWEGNDLVFTLTAAEGYIFPGDASTTTITWTDENTPCPVTPDASFFQIMVENCGPANDVVTYEQANVIADSGTWEGNDLVFTLTAAEGYIFPGDAFTTTFAYTDQSIPCPVTPDASFLQVTVENCGPANDVVSYEQENVIADSGVWEGNDLVFTLTAADGYIFPGDAFTTTITWTDENIPCPTEISPNVDLLQHQAVCGDNNDGLNFVQGGVVATISDWENNTATIAFAPAEGHVFPDDALTSMDVTDDGPCEVIPNLSGAPVAVCGVDNDEFTLADQPEGIAIEDTGWVDGSRTITATAQENYIISSGATTERTLIDEGIPCEVEPVGSELTLRFNTSDGGSIEGTTFQILTSMAAQVTSPIYAEGLVGVNNVAVIENVLPGEYRVVAEPTGYDPIDFAFTVAPGDTAQEITVEVAAIQVPPTPTPEPTVEPTATVAPTVEPTATVAPTAPPTAAPTAEPTTAVTGLPETGSGSGAGGTVLVLAGFLAAAMTALFIGSRRMETRRP